MDPITDILQLNYCMYSRWGATTIVRNDSVIVLNPGNPEHQQSNLCFRLRLPGNDPEAMNRFFDETQHLFAQVGAKPRYFIDCQATPSLSNLVTEFASRGYAPELDTDVIMALSVTQALCNTSTHTNVRLATMDDLDDLISLVAASYGYEDSAWLRRKLAYQCSDSKTFPIFVLAQDHQLVSAVILHLPPGLPHLGHINIVATHPAYHRHGLAESCLRAALSSHKITGKKVYLEVYDDLLHAQRLYQRVGFQSQGTMTSFTVYKEA